MPNGENEKHLFFNNMSVLFVFSFNCHDIHNVSALYPSYPKHSFSYVMDLGLKLSIPTICVKIKFKIFHCSRGGPG